MTEETLPAVTAAREALASIEALHPTAPIAVGSSTHGGPIQYDDGCRIHGAWCRDWTILQRDTAKLRDLLAVVDRLTAPVAREDVDAALDALDEQYGTITMTEIRHLVGPLRTFVSTAIVAASGRRHLPTEPEWEYAIFTAQGEHIWPLGPQDEEITETRDACVRALDDNDPDYWEPTDRIMRRSKPGPWEVCDEQ